MLHTMMQACKETNMTYQALKFYCNQGLVPNVKRDKNNRRVFDDRDIAWISSLICLKKCGMSIQEMKEYLSLCLMGESTIPPAQGDAGPEAGGAAPLHPGAGGQHGLYRLEAEFL